MEQAGGGGRKPYPLGTMLRIHLLRNWFWLSDPAMEEALYEFISMRQFAQLTLSAPIPEDTTIMNFRHLLEKHQLSAGILETINNYLRGKGLSLRHLRAPVFRCFAAGEAVELASLTRCWLRPFESMKRL